MYDSNYMIFWKKKNYENNKKNNQQLLEVGKKAEVKVVQSYPTLCDFMGYMVHGILSARILEWVAFPFSRRSSQSRIEPGSPALQVNSLPAELPGEEVSGERERSKSSTENFGGSETTLIT